MDSLSSSGRSTTPVFDKMMRPPTDERVPPVEPHLPPSEYHSYKDRSFETNIPDTNTNNVDLYGTLPRRKTQKSQEHVRQCNNQNHEAEVYQDFLENQRRQSGNHSRTSSGARTPVNEISSSEYQNSFSQNEGNYTNTFCNVNRNVHEQSGMNYLQNIQGHSIKPIPVVPPKLGNQSHHTEVCNQSKVKELPVSTRDNVWLQQTSHSYSSEHSNFVCQDNANGVANGESLQNPPVVRHGLYGTLPSRVRIGRITTSKPIASSATVQTAFSMQLPVTSSNLCKPVATDCYRLNEKRRQLDRSASFSHPSRPAANLLPQSRAGTKSVIGLKPFP